MKQFYLLLVAIVFSLQSYGQERPFITTWEVAPGDLQITINISGWGYNYNVDFGDGTVRTNRTNITSHIYSSPGIYTVSITGDFPRPYMQSDKIISVEQWGDMEWTSMASAFANCSNLVLNASDSPNLSQVTDLSYMFGNCISFNQSINHWDFSNITLMEGLFSGATSFNQPLINWDTSNVTSMEAMFAGATQFNQPLDNLDVSNVTNLSEMFKGASSFNQPLDNWDISNVEFINSIFYNATSFDQPLNNWNTSNLSDLGHVFKGATSFNQPLNNWDVSNVTYMLAVFSGASSFNQPLNDWDVSNVTGLDNMFDSASSFNQPLDNWDVSNVETMVKMFYNATSFNEAVNTWDTSSLHSVCHHLLGGMFEGATSFNQPLDNWDVSNVAILTDMFRNASSFNQSINNWDVSSVDKMDRMFEGASSFNQSLNDWDVSNVTHMQAMFSGATSYDQPMENWDVANAGAMFSMFHNASSFNQDLSRWPFRSTVSLTRFLNNSNLSVSNYDALLARFVNLEMGSREIGVQGLQYCNQSDRNELVNNLNWTISGDSPYANCNVITGTVLYDQNTNGCDPDDLRVNGIMINVTDETNSWRTSSIDGEYNMGIFGPSYTVSVVNTPSYFVASPESVDVTFTNSSTAVVDFCITKTQSVEDLNIILLPKNEARPGFEAQYRMVVQNVGTETIFNVEAEIEFDEVMQQFIDANPAYSSSTNNTLSFAIGTLQPFQTFQADITMLTFPPPTVEDGDTLNFTASISPMANDHTPDDNIYNLSQVVVNSFDPNDKQVLQGEELQIGDIDEYLDYIIRFQNVGTASVINVRILDTLHPKLDWNTLVPISSSHDYYLRITDGNNVEFVFDNIHLPAEATNEPESHGFIAYKIKPKNNVSVGDVITGDAAIFFDFNAPIVTNMVQTTIVEALGVPSSSNLKNKILVYPNPVNNTLYINLPKNIDLEEVIIYDIQGKEIQTFSKNIPHIDVANLASGIYFLKVITNLGSINRKWIKN